MLSSANTRTYRKTFWLHVHCDDQLFNALPQCRGVSNSGAVLCDDCELDQLLRFECWASVGLIEEALMNDVKLPLIVSA